MDPDYSKDKVPNTEADNEENIPEDNTPPSESTVHIRDPLTSDYVAGVKERAVLKEELTEVTKELNNVKGRNYDLLKKIEKLKKENLELTNLKSADKKIGKTKKPAKRKIPRSKTVDKKEMEGAIGDNAFEHIDSLYEEIAKRHPTLPLSTILVAQQKFTEADVNNDGTVDSVELEKMLDSASLMFTKDDVKNILANIDSDGSNSLDFFECLKVCDLLHNNRKTDLPQSLHQQKSALCSIQ